MSFSISGTILPKQEVGDPHDEVVRIFNENPDAKEHCGPDLIEVIGQAVSALSTELADGDEAMSFSAHGHYNGSLATQPRWASNQVTIGLTQIYNKPE